MNVHLLKSIYIFQYTVYNVKCLLMSIVWFNLLLAKSFKLLTQDDPKKRRGKMKVLFPVRLNCDIDIKKYI